MKCRGEATRREIVQNNELRPIAHVRLLAGQTKRSCTGDLLTDAYYCFSYEERGGSGSGSFFCGEHAASHFLELLRENPLPLFNPLSLAGACVPGAAAGVAGGRQQRTSWDPAAKQLYNAVNLLVVCWDSPPGPALADIKQKVERFGDRPPFSSQVKAVSTIISKDFKKRTLTEMIDELSIDNDIKPFGFELLNEILEKAGVESNYG